MKPSLFSLAATAGLFPTKNLDVSECPELVTESSKVLNNCNGLQGLPSFENTTAAETNTILNTICKKTCSDSILSFSNELQKCYGSEMEGLLPSLEMSIDMSCLKLGDDFCIVEQIEKTGAYSMDNIVNTNYTDLCSPCLKYQVDIFWAYQQQLGPSLNLTQQEIDAAKPFIYALVDSCSNESLTTGSDKIVFGNGSTLADIKKAAAGSGSKQNAAETAGISSASFFMNTLMIAGLFFML